MQGGQVADEDRVSHTFHADGRRIAPDRDDDRVTDHGGLASTGKTAPEQRNALAGADAGVTMAPALAGSPRVQGHRDFVIKSLLHGLTGPVGGTTYTQVMVPMGTQKDEWVAAIASYVRNSFGNTASFITPADVARVRAATPTRTASWTVDEIQSLLPTLLLVQPTWKATASHNAAIAGGGLTLAGWTTAAPQEAGMWWQVELPSAVNLTEIQFDVPNAGRGFGIGSLGGGDGRTTNSTVGQGAGGGNRGGAPAAPPPGLFPRGYSVQVSLDGATWSAPVAQGTGAAGQSVVSFKPVQAKFVRITQTVSDPGTVAWTMLNLRLYASK